MSGPGSTRVDAARLLGVRPDADPATVRRAFRTRVRDRHPDHAGPGRRAHDETAALIAAYDLLREPPSSLPDQASAPSSGMADDDTLVLSVPVAEAFGALIEAGHLVGDVTHIDPEAGLFEFLVGIDGRTCSVVVSLQGRMDSVEAWCTIDALDNGPRPSIAPIAAALEAALHLPGR